MTGDLLLRRLVLRGRGGESTFDFTKRVTVITGPVASGKTSLLELVKFGFGGHAVLTKTVKRHVREVSLVVKIGEERMVLTRAIGKGSDLVVVAPAGGDGEPIVSRQQVLPITGRQDEMTFSTFMLERLGVPRLRFPVSRREPDEALTSVTFHDIYGFMYLDQDQIDGAIGYEGARHQKWRQTFEVIYGLATSEIARIRTELGVASAESSRVASYLRESEKLLEAVGLLDSQTHVAAARQTALAEIARLDARLASLRSRMQSAESSRSRDAVDRLEHEVDRQRDRFAGEMAEREALGRVWAQLRTDVAQSTRAASVAHVLRELEFETCPRCLQALNAPVEVGACRLCTQPEPRRRSNLSAELEARRLAQQLAETEELVQRQDQVVNASEQELIRLREMLSHARREWDEQTRNALAPFMEQFAQLSQERGAAAARIQELDRASRLAEELDAARDEAARLKKEQARLTSQLHRAEGQLRVGRRNVAALSEAFAALIASVEMPWADTASIDPRRYIPLVDGAPVRDLSSGGLKTMANFAYYLAQLQVRLRGNPTYLPPLMIIDSPRKNFGSNQEDAESMRQFYRAVDALRQQRTATSFQVIVADNDSPSNERDRFQRLELSRVHPLVDAALLEGRGTSDDSS